MPPQRLPQHGGDPRGVGVVVPVRSFVHGKARLANVLGADARAALAREMADVVVKAAGGLPIVVITSGPEVVAWAAARGLDCIDDPGSLDAAAAAGRDWARAHQLTRVAIVHADLPLALTFDSVIDANVPGTDLERVAVLVPDHREDGTPVLVLPTAAPFRFAYGPRSFARHVAEAVRCGLEARVVRDPALGFDVDVPEDLARLAQTEGA